MPIRESVIMGSVDICVNWYMVAYLNSVPIQGHRYRFLGWIPYLQPLEQLKYLKVVVAFPPS